MDKQTARYMTLPAQTTGATGQVKDVIYQAFVFLNAMQDAIGMESSAIPTSCPSPTDRGGFLNRTIWSTDSRARTAS